MKSGLFRRRMGKSPLNDKNRLMPLSLAHAVHRSRLFECITQYKHKLGFIICTHPMTIPEHRYFSSSLC